MFENIISIFKKNKKKELLKSNSKDAAKERLHLVLMQDRANVSVDFLDLMRKEIIEVIKKYIDIDEKAMDVRLTTETNENGTQGAPALYANIPIINIKDEARKMSKVNQEKKIIEPPKEEDNEKDENQETKAKEEENKNTEEIKEEKSQEEIKEKIEENKTEPEEKKEEKIEENQTKEQADKEWNENKNEE